MEMSAERTKIASDADQRSELVKIMGEVSRNCLRYQKRHRISRGNWTVVGYFIAASTGTALRIDSWARHDTDQ